MRNRTLIHSPNVYHLPPTHVQGIPLGTMDEVNGRTKMEGMKICPLGCKRIRALGENLDVGSKAERAKGEIPMVRTLSFH